MINVQNVTKIFGRNAALKNVSFEIKKGEIAGFLGPNGAGKTTLMRILTTYLKPTEGQVEVAGLDVQKNPITLRKKIGYLPETPPLYPEMSVRDYLKFAAKIKDIDDKNIRAQIDKTLSDCDLERVQRSTIFKLSKGYKQRVGIAQAIIHNPEILILDEPTSGLDPLQIQQVRKLIKALEYERTIILSTHILSEIEQLAKRVIILKEGAIVSDESMDNLLKDPLKPNTRTTLENAFLRLTA